MNKSKAKGTNFESDIVKYFTAHGYEAERIALAGANDCGDVYAEKDGDEYVIECKAYKVYTPSEEREWRTQTLKEANNYFAKTGKSTKPLLIVKQYGKSIGRSIVHTLTLDGAWFMWYLEEFI